MGSALAPALDELKAWAHDWLQSHPAE